MSSVQVFWMVWGDNLRGPVVKHATRKDACTEAVRLAAQHPGTTFLVLEPAGAFRSPAPLVESLTIDWPGVSV